jgi:hypothetical protein
LGRRYERAHPENWTDASILADIATLAAATPELLTMTDGSAFNVPTAGGKWRGVVAKMHRENDEPVIAAHVRTFVE